MLSVFTKKETFPMLAFDHRSSFVKLLGASGTVPTYEEVVAIKKEVIQALVPYMSGVLVDEDYGLPALQVIHSVVPYVLPLEKTGYTDKAGERITEILRTPKELVSLGAQGAKLLLYVNKNVPSWSAQMKVAKNQAYLCKEAGIPLFLEFVLYDVPEASAGSVFETVQEAIAQGVTCDVWKLPYPGSKEECSKVSLLVGATPWILLTGGSSFETFVAQYYQAKEAGVSGFLAGRALWQDIGAIWNSKKEYHDFLQGELPRRFKLLIQ